MLGTNKEDDLYIVYVGTRLSADVTVLLSVQVWKS